MAGEIRLQATTGLTVKALIVSEAGTVWNGSALVAASTLSDAEWTSSLIACTEQDTSEATGTGLYLADWPGALTQGAVYSVLFFSGASPSPGDLSIGYQQDPTEYALAMLDDSRAEPGQGAPPVDADAMTKLDYLYKAMRNKSRQSGTEWDLYDDAGTTVDQKATISDEDGVTTKGKIATGP